MGHYSNYMLIKEKLLRQQQFVRSVLRSSEGTTESDGKLQMVETRLYVGLNDADKDIIQSIAKDLHALFHQESVLLTEDVVKGCYIM